MQEDGIILWREYKESIAIEESPDLWPGLSFPVSRNDGMLTTRYPAERLQLLPHRDRATPVVCV